MTTFWFSGPMPSKKCVADDQKRIASLCAMYCTIAILSCTSVTGINNPPFFD